MAQYVNGKRVNLPSSASASDIVRASNPYVNPATRAVIKKTPNGNYRVKPGERVSVKPGDKFQVGPDRVKGSGEAYFGNKQDWRKRVIESQVMDVSANLFKGASVNLDDDCNWVVFDAFKLPTAWAECNPGNERVKLMLIFLISILKFLRTGFICQVILFHLRRIGIFLTVVTAAHSVATAKRFVLYPRVAGSGIAPILSRRPGVLPAYSM